MNPNTYRAAGLAAYTFLAAWAATDFELGYQALLLSLMAALGGWVNPKKPEKHDTPAG